MDVRSGMVLDLSGVDNLTLIAYRFHGSENQQVRIVNPSSHIHFREELTLYSCLLSIVIMMTALIIALARRARILCCHFGRQWEFRPCGEGYTISSVYNDKLFLTVRDPKELYQEGRVQIVTGAFPTCWEVEVMGIAESPYEVFVRYVVLSELEAPVTVLYHECPDST
jgi:hypothetical protein